MGAGRASCAGGGGEVTAREWLLAVVAAALATAALSLGGCGNLCGCPLGTVCRRLGNERYDCVGAPMAVVDGAAR